MIVKIEGMMCQHCVNRVKTVLENIEGVKADVDLEKKQADVTMPEGVSFGQIKQAIEDAGFDVIE